MFNKPDAFVFLSVNDVSVFLFNFITYYCIISHPQGVNRRGSWAGTRVPVSVLRDVSGVSLLYWRRVPGTGTSDSSTWGGGRAGRRTENPPQPLLLESSQVTLPQETAIRALTQPARPPNPPTNSAWPDGIPLTSLWWWLSVSAPPPQDLHNKDLLWQEACDSYLKVVYRSTCENTLPIISFLISCQQAWQAFIGCGGWMPR